MFKYKAIFLFLLISSVLNAQQIPEEIILAFEKGKQKQLAEYFNENIELKILEKEYVTSKNQATRILQDFFKQNPPTEFSVTYQDDAKNSNYGMGILKSEESSFKVDFYFMEGREEKLIYYLGIEKL